MTLLRSGEPAERGKWPDSPGRQALRGVRRDAAQPALPRARPPWPCVLPRVPLSLSEIRRRRLPHRR
eukprot:7926426-Alexandrium_andersonii.AAC.1